MEFTENEIKIIRRALCDKALKETCRMLEEQKEEKEKGLDNFYSEMTRSYHDDIKKIIEKIDAENN